MRIAVLLSERHLEVHHHGRARALSFGRLLRSDAISTNPPEDLKHWGWDPTARVEIPKPRIETKPSQKADPGIDPLYLFLCGLEWQKQSNASAGWELVRCLKSSGQTARIAATLLAQAEHIELPVESVARATRAARQGPGRAGPLRPDAGKVVAS
jgi:hypothetical protein